MTDTSRHFSPRATLAAIGLKVRAIDLLAPLKEKVKVAQKTIKHEPIEKLQDALITILAGAHGLSEINTRLRADPALQRAFGRTSCADQSVVQTTLNACASTNVAQMMQALDIIFQRQSLVFRHDFRARMLLLDIDLTGLPCGKKCEDAQSLGWAEGEIDGYVRPVKRLILRWPPMKEETLSLIGAKIRTYPNLPPNKRRSV